VRTIRDVALPERVPAHDAELAVDLAFELQHSGALVLTALRLAPRPEVDVVIAERREDRVHRQGGGGYEPRNGDRGRPDEPTSIASGIDVGERVGA